MENSTFNPGTARQPTGLICCLLRWPERTEIGTLRPTFGWIVNDAAANQNQAAYRILVASSPECLVADMGDMWDSGDWNPGTSWTGKPQSQHVQYAGLPLEPGTGYWWKVKTWNSRNEASPWSVSQRFMIGEPSGTTPRQQIEVMEELPAAMVRTSPECLFLDFGRAAFGTMALTLTSDGQSALQIILGEVSRQPYRIEQNPGGSRRCRTITLDLKSGTHTYIVQIPPDARNTDTRQTDSKAAAILMPETIGEVLPFRYCEIHGLKTPVEPAQLVRRSACYPFDETASFFRSSDPILNDVWEFSRYTMKATSCCGMHVDGDRERIPYEADAYINQLGYYCCDREYALSRYTHEYLIRNPTWPTEWVLFSVLTAWMDYAYTGDASSLERFYDDLRGKSLLTLAREDGLISTVPERITDDIRRSIHFPLKWTPRDIVDWPQSERDGYELLPVNTVVNAFHYQALSYLSRIASVLGRNEDSSFFSCRAERVRQAMTDHLVDHERGLFVDGEGSTHASLHANMFPAAFGLVPDDIRRTVLEFFRGKGMACSVYGAQFLLEALYTLGADMSACALLVSRSERSWAHMIYDVGTTMALEAWDDRLKPNQDWNHAWGAAPANIIPRWLMGIRPEEPGFGRILIEPQPGPLAYAEMKIPTIRGPVHVCYSNQADGNRVTTLTIPANTTARIVLPATTQTDRIILDGNRVAPIRNQGKWIVDGIGSGTHRLTYDALSPELAEA